MDQTHDVNLKCWVEGADEHPDFPIQNLPFCCFEKDGTTGIGIGIGDWVLRLSEIVTLLDKKFAAAVTASQMNDLMNWSLADRREFRSRISQLLSADCAELRDDETLRSAALVRQGDVQFAVPCLIRDYTDFYASVYHATNVGSMFRPNNPLLPNYKHIPIGYHGRASSIVISDTDVRRPTGQLSPDEEGGTPNFGACKLLDYELEVGFFVSQGNDLGTPITIENAEDHLFGFCLVNDWSARDIQKWEYQPLGPFLAKSFATTISPWVVTMEALAPFRSPAMVRPEGDPQPLDYLTSEANTTNGLVDLNLVVSIQSEQMRNESMEPQELSRGSFLNMYWTPAQMVTHHSVNGCNLSSGDMMASGTVSGQSRDSRGCLLELTWDGEIGHPVPGTQRTPLQLPTGEERRFLADGDRIVFDGFCERAGQRRIGFGRCEGTILPAVS